MDAARGDSRRVRLLGQPEAAGEGARESFDAPCRSVALGAPGPTLRPDRHDAALGGDVEARQTGSWIADGPAFSCSVTRSEGKVFVTYGDPTTFLSLEQSSEQEGAEPITADSAGEGYLFGDSKPTAMWVCDDHVLAVELIDVDTDGRDGRDDAQRLLVSMLPWACDGAAVPQAG